MNAMNTKNRPSKAAEIRTLLAEGKSLDEIAEQMKVKKQYVIQVRWHWKQGAKKVKKTKKELKKPNVKYSKEDINKAWLKLADDASEWAKDRIQKKLKKQNDDKAAMGIGWHVDRKPDMVNSPAHYMAGGIETVDFIEAKKLGYNLGNAVKYISRADYKGKRLEDLKKAVWYLNREINRCG